MKLRILTLFAAAVFSTPTVCMADLLITLQQLPGNQVEISLSGAGTILGPSTIGTINNLDFVDFLGHSPYGPEITPDGSGNGHFFALADSLTLTINPDASGEFSQTYDTILLDNEGTSSDFSLIGIGVPLPVGANYEASGSAIVELEQLDDGGTAGPLLFSELNPGSYFTDSGFDASVFGGVTLDIVAVAIPEPSAVLIGCLVCTVFGYHSLRERNTPLSQVLPE